MPTVIKQMGRCLTLIIKKEQRKTNDIFAFKNEFFFQAANRSREKYPGKPVYSVYAGNRLKAKTLEPFNGN